MRVKENISLSFWIPVRQLKEGVNINGRELRYDDFDLTEAKVLKDKDGNYVKAVPFEIKEENGELPFYITDEEGNKITEYEITSDERTKRALSENEIPLNEATKQRYGIKDNKNELIPRKNKIKFNIPHYFILDGNKDLNPRETAENRKVQDITATKEDNKTKKYNLVFNKKAGNKYQDIIVEVKYDTEGTQWLNQYEDYTEEDHLKDLKAEISEFIKQVKDETSKDIYTEENNKSNTEEELEKLKKTIEEYLERQESMKFIYDDFIWKDDSILGITEQGVKKVNDNGGKLVIPEGTQHIAPQAFRTEDDFLISMYEDLLRMYKEGDMTLEEYEYRKKGLLDIPEYGYHKILGYESHHDVHGNVTAYEVDAFYKVAKRKKEVEIKEVVFPKTLQTIGKDTFRDQQFKNLDLSNLPEIRSIDSGAFCGTGIEILKMSNLPKFESIGYIAFAESNIKTMELNNLPNLKTIKDVAFRRNKIETFKVKNVPRDIKISKDVYSHPFEYNPHPEDYYEQIIRNNPQE